MFSGQDSSAPIPSPTSIKSRMGEEDKRNGVAQPREQNMSSTDDDGSICEFVDSADADDEEVTIATTTSSSVVVGGGNLQPRCSISQFIRRLAFTIYHAAFFLEGRQVWITFPRNLFIRGGG